MAGPMSITPKKLGRSGLSKRRIRAGLINVWRLCSKTIRYLSLSLIISFLALRQGLLLYALGAEEDAVSVRDPMSLMTGACSDLVTDCYKLSLTRLSQRYFGIYRATLSESVQVPTYGCAASL